MRARSDAVDDRPPAAPTRSEAPRNLEPLTSLDIVYVDVDLKTPGLMPQPELDPKLVEWKVPDIARLMAERASKLLADKGLTGSVTVLPAPQLGSEPDLNGLATDRPTLLLRISSVTVYSPRPFVKAGGVKFSVRVLHPPLEALPETVQLFVGGGLGFDPVWGLFKTNRVDAAWIDGVLATALRSLSEQGVLKLP